MTEQTENVAKNPLEGFELKSFVFDRVLSSNPARKLIFVLGKFPNKSENEQSILTIEMIGYTESSFKSENEGELVLKHTELEFEVANDIYINCFGYAAKEFNKLKIGIIHPATEKHIQKYSEKKFKIVEETAEIYQKAVLPYVTSQLEQFTLDWVYNILEHKQEVDKIIYEDLDPQNGFMLLPDYKWNGQNETMYLLAIVMDRSIKSLRDLTAAHLPLLENIRTKSIEAIHEKFGLAKEDIRAYFHYQPSFYHLHVHFTYLGYDAPGIHCARAHLLDNVISNIKLMPDYYQKASLTFSTFETDKILAAIEKAGQESSPPKQPKTTQ